jgi:predicted DNA-binding WGR domain protein
MDRQRVASELVKVAKSLMGQDSAYKTKLPSLKEQRPVIFKALKGMVNVPGRGAKRVYENYMTFSEGTSNKFHYFAIYEIEPKERGGKSEFVGANAYGRIGGSPRGIEIARGDSLSSVKAEVLKKEKAKKAKGYAAERHASSNRLAVRREMVASIFCD